MVHRVPIGDGGSLELSEEQRRRWGFEPGAEFLVQERPEGLLLRRADPVLTRVYVEPTNGCNLSCRTCVRNSWSEPVGSMSMDTYRRLVDGLRSVPSLQFVSFWGLGEPLLHPGIVEMVALARGLGAKTEMVTNGLLLSREVSESLVEAGLDSLVVSVDGTSLGGYADIRSGADLDAVRRNVDELRIARQASPEGKPEIGLEFVVMRSNLGELSGLRRLASSMGATFVVVTNVLPYTEELSDEILYGWNAGTCYPVFPSSWSPRIRLPRFDAHPEVLEALSGLLVHSETYESPQGRLDGAGGYCRFVGEGAAAVAWDGGVSPCIALMHSYPCYVMRRPKQIRRYTLGNVGSQDILQIWESDEYVRFRARVQRFDFSPCTDCGGCEYRESNEEDCFGNVHPTCGDCLWAKGVIQCP